MRSSLPPDAIAGVIRERIAAFDHALVQHPSMDEVVASAVEARFNLLLVGSFAVLAFSWPPSASMVSSHSSSRSGAQDGIRMARARASDVAAGAGRGMAPVGLGGLAGVLAALAATARFVMLFGVTPLIS